MITVSITLTIAGVDTGPTFSLFSNTDSYATAFATGVTKAALQAGYISTVVPDGTTIVRVFSPGTCNTYVDLNVLTSTTTTTTIATPTTTTTTTTSSVTTTTTTTISPPAPTSIRVVDSLNSSAPVSCDGTVPPTTGTTYYNLTTATLQDQFGNPILAISNITVVVEYDFDACTGGPAVPENQNITILAGQSSGVYSYTQYNLVDCGESNCEPETKNYVGTVSNSAGLPFV